MNWRCVLLTLGLGAVTPMAATADCGSMPIMPIRHGLSVVQTEEKYTDVEFDPLEVTVFEPKQRAIILWNGEEEILLLSTDQQTAEDYAVLEVIPLPGKPTVRLGDFETFERAQEMVVKRRTWAMAHPGAGEQTVQIPEHVLRVDFEEKLGAHDVAVVEVTGPEAFTSYVQTYIQQKYGVEKAPIRPDFVQIIQSYIDDGFRWFVFDRIELGEKVQSRQPIEYRFPSDAVFYPMRISTLEEGKTEVEMLVVTEKMPTAFEGLTRKSFKIEDPITLDDVDLETLEPGWKGFFGDASPPFTLNQWTIEGDIQKFKLDVIVK